MCSWRFVQGLGSRLSYATGDLQRFLHDFIVDRQEPPHLHSFASVWLALCRRSSRILSCLSQPGIQLCDEGMNAPPASFGNSCPQSLREWLVPGALGVAVLTHVKAQRIVFTHVTDHASSLARSHAFWSHVLFHVGLGNSTNWLRYVWSSMGFACNCLQPEAGAMLTEESLTVLPIWCGWRQSRRNSSWLLASPSIWWAFSWGFES